MRKIFPLSEIPSGVSLPMVDLYKADPEAAPLSPDSRFCFACHPGLACFTRCCQKPTIILKPYDILRLRRRLGLTSGEFLDRYTLRLVDNASRLPLVLLAVNGEAGCPFLGPGGCAVYEDRPGACRLFPVTQGSRLAGHRVEDAYFLKRLDFCQGFGAGKEWTLAQWRADQELEFHEAFSGEWLEILLKRGAQTPGAEDARAATLFYMAAYDLDRFRHFVLQTPLRQILEIPVEVAGVLETSDEELLRFGYTYLKMTLRLDGPRNMVA